MEVVVDGAEGFCILNVIPLYTFITEIDSTIYSVYAHYSRPWVIL